MDNLTMARQGHGVTIDGLHLAWPLGGEREVVYFPPERRTRRILLRISNGAIRETDEPATVRPVVDVKPPVILTGEAARERRAMPAGQVTRQQADPTTKQLVQVPIHTVNMPRIAAGVAPPAPADPMRMTKAQLIEHAESLGIDSSGTKGDILARLATSDAA